MVVPQVTLMVDSFSEMPWDARTSLAQFDLFSEAPLLGMLPLKTNSSTMPSISWILSVPLKTPNGSEDAVWGCHDSLSWQTPERKDCWRKMDELFFVFWLPLPWLAIRGGWGKCKQLGETGKRTGIREVKRKWSILWTSIMLLTIPHFYRALLALSDRHFIHKKAVVRVVKWFALGCTVLAERAWIWTRVCLTQKAA